MQPAWMCWREAVLLALRAGVDTAWSGGAHSGVGRLHCWVLVMLRVTWVARLELGLEAREGGHHLGGQAAGRDEGLGHAHGHGDDVGQGEEGLRVGRPHVGVLLLLLLPGRGHGQALRAAGARGLRQRAGGAGGRGGHRGEGGVAGHTCEGRVAGGPGGAWGAWIREREVTVAHVGQVVVLVVGQERGGVVVMVLVVVWERGPWKERTDTLFICGFKMEKTGLIQIYAIFKHFHGPFAIKRGYYSINNENYARNSTLN